MYSLPTSFLSTALLALPTLAQVCYKSNGQVAEDDKPCRPKDPHSSCCGGTQYTCSTNGLCGSPADGSFFVVGTCTDPTWKDPACPNVCFADSHINNSVLKCLQANTYCCVDGPKCDCDTGVNTQHFPDVQPPYSVLTADAAASSTTTSAVSTASISTSVNTDSTTKFTSILPSSTPSSEPFPATTSTNPIQNSSSSQNTHTLAVGLGVGLGVALFFVLAGIIALLFFRKMKKSRVASDSSFASGAPPYSVRDSNAHTFHTPAEADGYYGAKRAPSQIVHEAPGSVSYTEHTVPKTGS